MTLNQRTIIRMAKAIEFYEQKYLRSIGTDYQEDYSDVQLILERGILDVCQCRDSKVVEEAMTYVKQAELFQD